MIRTAFSMVELIFVIVLMGILASVGGNLLPDNKFLNDTNYMIMKIKETQKNAIGNDVIGFGKPWSSNFDNNTTCIKLTKEGFLAKDSNSQKTHRFSIKDFDAGTLCFDEYGRPYQSERLLLEKKDINVTYNDKTNKISVMPISGYVILNN